MTDKPTQEQQEEFWGLCGFTSVKDDKGIIRIIVYPDNERHCKHPPLDLNNLFKWAVPKVTSKYIELEIHLDYLIKSNTWNVALLDGFYDKDESKYLISVKNSTDPALALFWALYEALGGKK